MICYDLADRIYDDYIVSCCIEPTAYYPAVQSKKTIHDYAPITVEIRDNNTGRIIMTCTYDKDFRNRDL